MCVDSHKFRAIMRNYGRETNRCAYTSTLLSVGHCFLHLVYSDGDGRSGGGGGGGGDALLRCAITNQTKSCIVVVVLVIPLISFGSRLTKVLSAHRFIVFYCTVCISHKVWIMRLCSAQTAHFACTHEGQ